MVTHRLVTAIRFLLVGKRTRILSQVEMDVALQVGFAIT
jgi:hypothetical protein